MHHFYAFMARMKHIRRWGLMRNIHYENDQEHSLQVAMIAHGLAEIRILRYGGAVDIGKLLKLAIYHEAAEVITGDLASPIKYHNPKISGAFKQIEHLASEKLITFLPADLQGIYREILFPNEESIEWKLVKVADKISAYLKCVEEMAAGNREFERAEQKLRQILDEIDLSEVKDFIRQFVPSFALSLDGLN